MQNYITEFEIILQQMKLLFVKVRCDKFFQFAEKYYLKLIIIEIDFLSEFSKNFPRSLLPSALLIKKKVHIPTLRRPQNFAKYPP